MRQYNQIKQKHPDALLLFRVGDFYETFGDDAIHASRILGIVLTKRANGSASHIELAGFPHHSLDTYLPKLIRAGQRVAICDQLEDPKLTKKIVKRGVTELVTPGLTTHDHVLSAKKNNFLASVFMGKKQSGIAFCDLSTGEFLCAEGDMEYLEKLIQSFEPAEILFAKPQSAQFKAELARGRYSFSLDDWVFKEDYAIEQLNQQFQTRNLKGFGVDDLKTALVAAGSIIHYLKDTRHTKLQHISSIQRINRETHMWMDRFTIRNLELFQSNASDGLALIDVLDQTSTAMGGRQLKRWLAMPLLNEKAIERRLAIVEHFVKDGAFSDSVFEQLKGIADLERLSAKLSANKIGPKELLTLKRSSEAASALRSACLQQAPKHFRHFKDTPGLNELTELIERYIDPEAPAVLSKGDVIKSGINEELDGYRDLLKNGKQKLLDIQERETEATGISSLKIAFNNVFGYYLEVRNTHKDKVPEEWVRKQTLVNAERYITPELKTYEQKILEADEQVVRLEQQAYQELLDALSGHISAIQKNARLVAFVDCLIGFALLAKKHNYVKPTINNQSDTLQITDGRHPVIETTLPIGERYVGNSVSLSSDEEQILMITGPNMSGKSALLRQTALISILAQMGCFVPAKSAELGIVDKVFVRVGASDNISQGESTFMVEMNETASILNNLSDRSLVLLDEIGRGTSTYDGISIAWAIAEYLHEHPAKAKTLFATHYHELNEMEKSFERIHNFNVSVKETDGKILFLRKLKKGGSAHSFGIHVARMAGMPQLMLNRAERMLKELEKSRTRDHAVVSNAEKEMQLSFFQLDDPILEEVRDDIKGLDINTLTPVEALMKLNEIKKKLAVE
jgi:DNA mismatch repair protein MutS